MALENNLVLKDKFEPGYLGPTTDKEVGVILEKGMPALTKNGILGDPRKASAEKGEIYIERLADFLVHEIAKQSIDKYQQRTGGTNNHTASFHKIRRIK